MKTFPSGSLVILILLYSSFTLISCKENITSPEAESPIPNPYSSVHFTYYYTSYDSLSIKATSDSLEQHYVKVLSDLLTDTIAPINIHFYKTHQELAAAVANVVPNLPSWAIGLATAKDQIHMISLKHPDYYYEDMLQNLIHEFAHCVSLNINPSFGNRPRWLWESVAIFESDQFIHPSYLQYLVQQNPPTLSQLNSINNTQIYEVGYFLAEYIVAHWSRQHLKDLIISYGNISQTLGITSGEFEAGWFQFVKDKYGI